MRLANDSRLRDGSKLHAANADVAADFDKWSASVCTNGLFESSIVSEQDIPYFRFVKSATLRAT